MQPPTSGDELAKLVTARAVQHILNPDRPLLKIGRFDAQVDLGRGGFGIVFKARDPELHRWVALKLCRAKPHAIETLMDEARVLAGLTHPNIVTVYEPGRHEDAVFYAMQYIDGVNAQDWGERDPTWQEIVDVYRGVARGLAAAHDAGIMHGDVKPSNILLDRDDFPRIADFGLAQKVIENAEESEQEGLRHRAGTLCYMAPEVLRGQLGDALADQWSFCVSLLHTLNGELPFVGETSAEVLEEIETTDVRFEDPTIPAELLAVLRIGLSEDPRERFPDMHALLAELDRLREPPSSIPFDEPDADPDDSDDSKSARSQMPSGESEPASVSEPELMPLRVEAAPPTNKPKRGSFAVALLIGMSCAVAGWVGRGQSVESPSAPVPLPSSPCSLGDETEGSSVNIDPRVIPACTYIRQERLLEANDYWLVVYKSRRDAIKKPDPVLQDSAHKLAADTMIVVQTYRDQAERFARQPGKQAEAKDATHYANEWAARVAEAQAHDDTNDSTGESSDSSVEPTN